MARSIATSGCDSDCYVVVVVSVVAADVDCDDDVDGRFLKYQSFDKIPD